MNPVDMRSSPTGSQHTEWVPGLVSIVLVNYNGLNDLEVCLNSILRQTYTDFEVILVDSASTDGSVDFVRDHFPQIRVIASPVNVGYGGGNAIGIREATGQYIAVSNVDVEVAPDWLEKMVAVIEADPQTKVVTPKILMYDDREIVNTCGNRLQYMGFGTCRGRGDHTSRHVVREDLAFPSGASFLIERDVLERVGGFELGLDQRLEEGARTTRYYYHTAHIIWRVKLLGYRLVLVPEAEVYHKYVVKPLTPQRFSDLEVTRPSFILANLSLSTLVVLIPSLMFGELMSLGFALILGPRVLVAKIRSYGVLWRGRGEIKRLHALVNGLRSVPDSALFKELDYTIDFAHQVKSNILLLTMRVVLNAVLRVMYELSYWGVRLVDAVLWHKQGK